MPLSTAQLRLALERVPRTRLAHLPTPLEFLPRFSAAVGGPRIFIKRDDCTGLLFGGNKARHNEFLMGDALAQNTDIFVWGAGVQSNNCRQTAAACARLGLDCHLLLGRGKTGWPETIQGNLLLDHLVGAHVDIVDEAIGPALDERIAATAARYREQGRRVYYWDKDRVKPLAALSYALCLTEIAEQVGEAGCHPAAVYVSSAGSTGAGVALGRAALGLDWHIQSIAPMQWPWDTQADMTSIAQAAGRLIGIETTPEDVHVNVTFDYIPPEYGKVSAGGLAALSLLARTEGIVLDHIYTAKAMAGLIDHIQQGRWSAGQDVVFIHTGGTPVLFAYNDVLVEGIEARRIVSVPTVKS